MTPRPPQRTRLAPAPTPGARISLLRPAAALLLLVGLGPLAAPAGAQMPRGRGQVRGAVSDPDGEPLVGISIVLQPTSREDVFYATSTDDKGRYALNGLVADVYRIRADGQGFLPELKEGVRVQPPFRAIIDFAMAPSAEALAGGATPIEELSGVMRSVQGRLVNHEGEPVLEGSVMLERSDASGEIHYARTDPDGRFEFSNLPAGRYDVTTRSPGLIPLHLIDRRLPGGDTIYVQLVAPSYPLAFKGWLDDLLPPEIPVPPPAPRSIELGPHGVAPRGESPSGEGTPAEDAPAAGGTAPAEDTPAGAAAPAGPTTEEEETGAVDSGEAAGVTGSEDAGGGEAGPPPPAETGPDPEPAPADPPKPRPQPAATGRVGTPPGPAPRAPGR